MSVFAGGGSAYNMAQSIADGYIIATELTFKQFKAPDFQNFLFEADRLLREVRGTQAPPDDVMATQNRQRRLQRLQQAIVIANNARSRRL
jgi:hypothetical protein